MEIKNLLDDIPKGGFRVKIALMSENPTITYEREVKVNYIGDIKYEIRKAQEVLDILHAGSALTIFFHVGGSSNDEAVGLS